jgi:ribosome biogenesis protein BRX1|eukprot:COSAG01_NODE_4529_length_4949_cov_224.324124_2_plen_137_part_00
MLGEPMEEEPAVVATAITPFKNKNKVLVLSSRGVNYRVRHLMQDFIDLLPHSKKDVKIAEKSRLDSVNEVCDMKGCNLALFFEARKKKDFYLWVARAPDGPSVKFHVINGGWESTPRERRPSALPHACICTAPREP